MPRDPSERVCRAIDLDAVRVDESSLDERERRHAGDRHGLARRRYVAAHGALREELAAHLDCKPAAISYRYACARCGSTEHGRPELDDPNPQISFSLSHSASVAVIAIAPERVGVDVEVIRPRDRLDRLAARVLSAEAFAGWDGDLETFLRAWTAKEAYLKQLGVGLTRRLRDVEPRGVQTFTDWPPGCVTSVALDGPGASSVRWSRR
jgi:4'-phosphopantetheinyl transferase